MCCIWCYPHIHGVCIHIHPSLAFTFIYLFIVYYRFSYFILFTRVLLLFYYVYCFIRSWTKHWRCCCWNLFEFNCNSLKLRIIVICFRYKKWANCLSVEFYSGCFIDRSLKTRRLKRTKRLDHDLILCLYIMSFYKTAIVVKHE